MQPTLSRLSQATGHHGIGFAAVKPRPKVYISPYGPKYKTQPNIMGVGPRQAMRSLYTAAGFSVAGAAMALQFFSEVPKVRTDIVQKIPFVGEYFEKSVPPEDNVSVCPDEKDEDGA